MSTSQKMLICCVPSCFTNSRRCHSSITFHEFPTNPDMHAKWVKNINTVVKNGGTWHPPEGPFVCSKHFLPGDYKRDSKLATLKPRAVPTIFTNILGFTYKRKDFTHSPLIVKIAKKVEGENVNDNSKCEKRPCKRHKICDTNAEDRLEATKSKLRYAMKLAPGSSGTNLGSCNHKCSVTNKKLLMTKFAKDNALVISQPVHSSYTKVKNVDSTSEASTNCPLTGKNGDPQLPKKAGGTSKKKSAELELIEIGPNTFLKINPDVIKITKKITPSGNHVLQFLMNQNSMSEKSLPSLVTTSPTSEILDNNSHPSETNSQLLKNSTSCNGYSQPHKNVEHVLGHLVENPLNNGKNCRPQEKEMNCRTPSKTVANDGCISDSNDNSNSRTCLAESECIANAPMLLTTNIPVSHCFTDKQKLVMQLKQKSRLVNSLRAKITRLTKRLEDMENKCVVQERQLSYTNIKKLKTIKKNSTKGDANAMYILEQIRAYSGRTKMHWSESTLRQCGVWCKKAPYAYEYFKKASLFKLPCLSTVKRYMKKNPQLLSYEKVLGDNEDNNESSSDFNFDDSDEDDHSSSNVIKNSVDSELQHEQVDLGNEGTVIFSHTEDMSERESVRIQSADAEAEEVVYASSDCNERSSATPGGYNGENTQEGFNNLQPERTCEIDFQNSTQLQPSNFHRNSNVQEIVLQNGEVVQCLNSKLTNGQYYIIPSLEEPAILADHQYSVVQSHEVPFIIQNVENNDLSLEQSEQLIFITQTENQPENSQVKVDS